jgi:hypothetical protein
VERKKERERERVVADNRSHLAGGYNEAKYRGLGPLRRGRKQRSRLLDTHIF